MSQSDPWAAVALAPEVKAALQGLGMLPSVAAVLVDMIGLHSVKVSAALLPKLAYIYYIFCSTWCGSCI